MSFFHEVLTSREPSLSPRAGSFIKKMMRKTEMRDRMGVIRKPQCHDPVAAATPEPVI